MAKSKNFIRKKDKQTHSFKKKNSHNNKPLSKNTKKTNLNRFFDNNNKTNGVRFDGQINKITKLKNSFKFFLFLKIRKLTFEKILKLIVFLNKNPEFSKTLIIIKLPFNLRCRLDSFIPYGTDMFLVGHAGLCNDVASAFAKHEV